VVAATIRQAARPRMRRVWPIITTECWPVGPSRGGRVSHQLRRHGRRAHDCGPARGSFRCAFARSGGWLTRRRDADPHDEGPDAKGGRAARPSRKPTPRRFSSRFSRRTFEATATPSRSLRRPSRESGLRSARRANGRDDDRNPAPGRRRRPSSCADARRPRVHRYLLLEPGQAGAGDSRARRLRGWARRRRRARASDSRARRATCTVDPQKSS
jgi:hypothetical protein